MEDSVVFTIAQTECFFVHVLSQSVVPLTEELTVLKCCQHPSGTLVLKIDTVSIPLEQFVCVRISRGAYLFTQNPPEGVDSEFLARKMYLICFARSIPQPFLDLFETHVSKAVEIKPVSGPIPVIIDAKNHTPIYNTAYEEEMAALMSTSSPHPIAKGIENASATIASTITTWSGHLSNKIESTGQRAILSSAPTEKEHEIPDSVSKTIGVAKVVSPVIARVSTAVVQGVVTAAVSAGAYVGDKISEKIEDKEVDPRYYAAKEIGRATLASIGTVWEALDDAAGVLFDTTVGTTNIVIEHKYGSNVAEAVVDSCLIGRDVYVTATSVKALKPSAITKNFAKTTAKEAGKTVITKKLKINTGEKKEEEDTTEAIEGDEDDLGQGEGEENFDFLEETEGEKGQSLDEQEEKKSLLGHTASL